MVLEQTDFDLNTLQGRIAFVLGQFPNQSELARQIGISESGLRKWKTGATPRGNKLALLAELAGVPIAWLLTGAGSPGLGLNPPAGDGRHTEDNIQRLGKFAEWMQHIQSNPAYAQSDLDFLVMAGDNMAPTLMANEFCIFDRAAIDFGNAPDGIYVLNFTGAEAVRRLRRLPAGGILLASDNPHYQVTDVVIDLKSPPEGISLVGRIVFFQRSI
jgi:phage repressor protein C with HTH and peptisase S24 domain